MDRFRACSLSRRTHLHLLGLFPSALAEGFGIAHRSSVAQRRTGAAPARCRRRALGPRPTPCQRPRADLDRVGYGRGIIIKGGLYLEQLNRIDIVVLDKTGTL